MASKIPAADARARTAMETESASAYLREVLRRYGLEELTGWARDELAQGYEDVVVLQHLREQPRFQERFKVIFERERLGLPPMSPEEVINYEAQAHQLLRASGLPAGFYDSPDDFERFMIQDISVNELSKRIEGGWNRVIQAPTQVREAFRDFFGVDGDGALAAFMLNPDVAMPILETQIATAELGGTGRRFGIELGQPVSEQLARTGVTVNEAEQKFQDLHASAGLYAENIGEDEDLVMEREGVQATFGLDQEARQKVNRRASKRQASLSGGGGATQGQQGVVGLGTSGG